MSESAEQSRKIQRLDPLLVAALSLAFLFCLQGITWGRVEDWNRSSIAMRSLHALRPSDYMKPPFHTYLNYVLVVWPITGALKIANPAKLIGSRLVTVALFLGTIALTYSFSRRSYGRFSAVIIAFTFATSAGFVAYAHFLTVDIPLLFWMLAAFWAMAKHHVRRHGFIRARSISWMNASLSCSGKIEDLDCHLGRPRRRASRHEIASRNLRIGRFT